MKKLLITIGDPTGIGPFITVKALKELALKKVNLQVIGSRKILEEIKDYSCIATRVNLIDIKSKALKYIRRAHPNKYSGSLALEYLNTAIEILKKDKNFSLVTAPLSKEAVKAVKRDFIGHTEYLAQKFSVKNFSMLMVGKRFRILLLTRHIPLREVSNSINYKYLYKSLNLLILSLKNLFKLRKIKIALCSLNPHAGIETFLEKEEKVLIKVKKSLEHKNLKFIGPFPSDTLFRKALKEKYSAIVAFYHDQGMIPFKTLEFPWGVNLTIGLPFIRTSPAHGPGFDLVNRPYLIDSHPMKEAIKLALKLSNF